MGKGGGGEGQTETNTKTIESSQERQRYVAIVLGRYGNSTLKTSRTSGGASSPTPLHPHPSQVPPDAQVGGANPQNRDTGQDTRGSMAPAASKSYGRMAGDNRRHWGFALPTCAAGGT